MSLETNHETVAHMINEESQSLGPRGMDKMVGYKKSSLIGLPDLILDSNWKR